MKIVVLGLSLSSSWGNGHATTFRALLRSFSERGHDVLFLERNVPWYAANRDLSDPGFCRLELYDRPEDLEQYCNEVATADAVMIGSFVPDGIAVSDWIFQKAAGVTVFYDIDTPATLACLGRGSCTYLSSRQIPLFDLYLSFTGGPILRQLETEFGARSARPLYCSADTQKFRPAHVPFKWDLSYLGTYSADRQPALDELLLQPARMLPDKQFVVAGAQYPQDIDWPSNVQRLEHVSPDEIPRFFAHSRWTLNITREEMRTAGYCPSVRLFEASACGAPVLSDTWPGLNAFFEPDREIVLVATKQAVLDALSLPEPRRTSIAAAARKRALHSHSSTCRAAELETYIAEIRLPKRPKSLRAEPQRNRSTAVMLSRRET